MARKLDREMVEDYNLVITAKDGGNKVCNDIQNASFSVSCFPFYPFLNGAGSLIPLVEVFLRFCTFSFCTWMIPFKAGKIEPFIESIVCFEISGRLKDTSCDFWQQ